MAEVGLSEQARVDLQLIRAEGVERFGEEVAERHLQSIRYVFDLLSRHPLAGQERPEFRARIRAVSRRPHRILYEARANDVFVVRILHQAQDVMAALNDTQ